MTGSDVFVTIRMFSAVLLSYDFFLIYRLKSASHSLGCLINMFVPKVQEGKTIPNCQTFAITQGTTLRRHHGGGPLVSGIFKC